MKYRYMYTVKLASAISYAYCGLSFAFFFSIATRVPVHAPFLVVFGGHLNAIENDADAFFSLSPELMLHTVITD